MKNISEVISEIEWIVHEHFTEKQKNRIRDDMVKLLDTVPRELEVHEGMDLGLYDIENWLEEAKK